MCKEHSASKAGPHEELDPCADHRDDDAEAWEDTDGEDDGVAVEGHRSDDGIGAAVVGREVG